MEIRDFRQADFDKGLLECLNALATTAFDTKARITQFTYERKERGVRTFVATEKSRGKQVIVGTYSVFVEPKFIHGGSYVGHIEDVCVHPHWQGKGVGKALMRHAVAHCVTAGCYKVVLDCLPELVPFYQQFGFYSNGDGMRLDLDSREGMD